MNHTSTQYILLLILKPLKPKRIMQTSGHPAVVVLTCTLKHNENYLQYAPIRPW